MKRSRGGRKTRQVAALLNLDTRLHVALTFTMATYTKGTAGGQLASTGMSSSLPTLPVTANLLLARKLEIMTWNRFLSRCSLTSMEETGYDAAIRGVAEPWPMANAASSRSGKPPLGGWLLWHLGHCPEESPLRSTEYGVQASQSVEIHRGDPLALLRAPCNWQSRTKDRIKRLQRAVQAPGHIRTPVRVTNST